MRKRNRQSDMGKQSPDKFINLGNLNQSQDNHAKAISHYKQALDLDPKNHVALNNLGTAFYNLGELDKAQAAYEEALKISPNYSGSLNGLGIISALNGNPDLAIEYFKKALSSNPTHIPSYNGLGQTLRDSGKLDDAINMFETSIAINPANFQAHYQLAEILRESSRFNEAENSYKTALSLNPDHARAWGDLAVVYKFQNRLPFARACLEKAISIDSSLPHLFFNLAMIFEAEKDFKNSILNLEKAIGLASHFRDAIIKLYLAKRIICDWDQIDNFEKLLDEKKYDSPFLSILRKENPSINYDIAINWSEKFEKTIPQNQFAFESRLKEPNSKIRIGYISRDFRDHPIGHLVASMFSHHDRKKFDVYAYSYGSGDKSEYHNMIVSGVDKFIDLDYIPAGMATQKIYADKIDVLIDLTSHTVEGRLDILAQRPAPIMVTWLGFPGTSGASFFDYAIVDKVVVPKNQAQYYTEKLIYLPRCYQVNNDKIKISDKKYTKKDFNLPEKAFIFASFNKTAKIDPQMWHIWMSILKRVTNSVLWLWKFSDLADENLKKEAVKHNIDSERLVFSGKLNKNEHLKRLGLADLGLDTRIYGGHVTTSDMLWAGVPVLTKIGNHFASRVCASALTEAEIPEMITNTLEEYEDKAVYLANNPLELSKIRAKITHENLKKNLYDTEEFVKDLEKVYEVIWKNWENNEHPKQIEIT